MTTKSLIARTPVGHFERTTHLDYQFVVVRRSAWVTQEVARIVATGWKPCGLMARRLKDRGHVVTWHQTRSGTERSAAARSQDLPRDCELVGIFPVTIA